VAVAPIRAGDGHPTGSIRTRKAVNTAAWRDASLPGMTADGDLFFRCSTGDSAHRHRHVTQL